jgi:regulator of sigma E protease
MSIIIFLIVLALLILVHEFGHFITAKKSGIKVEEFGIGFPPKLWSWKSGETTYSINLIPFGGFVKIFGEEIDDQSSKSPRSFLNKSKKIQVLVLSAGVLFNVLFAWILISLGFVSGLPTSIGPEQEDMARDTSLLIITVVPNTPAAEAGLEIGDSILAVGNIQEPSSEEVQEIISQGNIVSLHIQRGEEDKVLNITPEENIVPETYAIGISMDRVGLLKLPIHLAFWEGLKLTGNLLIAITIALFYFVVGIFSGTANFSQISGPIGIVSFVSGTVDLGFIYLVSFTAFISLHLAIINLIPVPALDGGRILFILIEAIKGSPINPKIQNNLNRIGFVLLIILMLAVTYNDVVKIFFN